MIRSVETYRAQNYQPWRTAKRYLSYSPKVRGTLARPFVVDEVNAKGSTIRTVICDGSAFQDAVRAQAVALKDQAFKAVLL